MARLFAGVVRGVSIAAVLLAFADQASAGGFSFRGGGVEVDGPNDTDLERSSTTIERTDGIREGTSGRIDLSFEFAQWWSISAFHSRSSVSYVNPQAAGCGLDVGLVTRFAFCQVPTNSSPDGLISEQIREWGLQLERRAALSDRFSVLTAIGFGVMRWGTGDDLEAQTFSTCALDAGSTQIRPDCVSVDDRAQSSGWAAAVRGAFDLTSSVTASAGARWQGYRHDAYRYDALRRFLDAARRPCEPFDWCSRSADRFLNGREPRRGDWWWYTASIDWNLGEHWTLGIDGAWGGSRDWETLGASIAYRW